MPEDWGALMAAEWQEDPVRRPDFAAAVSRLDAMLVGAAADGLAEVRTKHPSAL
jgi:hypothetical protein